MTRSLMLVIALIFGLAGCTGESPVVGTAAPEFRLQDQEGRWHELADYRGQWLALYFYPQNGTPGCTTEACNFRDNIYRFRAVDANVVGVSTDDVDSHREFATEYKLPFTILADPEGKVCDRYGVLRDFGIKKMASRQSFLVNPEGVIVKHYPDVNPDIHTDEVLADIETFRSKG